LRLLGEDAGWPVLWFLLAAVLSAAVAWWSARVMFYFRFRNPASAPHVFSQVKEYLPRALGASVLVLTALALLQVSFSYDGWSSGPPAACACWRWRCFCLRSVSSTSRSSAGCGSPGWDCPQAAGRGDALGPRHQPMVPPVRGGRQMMEVDEIASCFGHAIDR
jgi:hypothetical protein